MEQLTKEKVLKWIEQDISWREVNGKLMACFKHYLINKGHAGVYDISYMDNILDTLCKEGKIKRNENNGQVFFTLNSIYA